MKILRLGHAMFLLTSKEGKRYLIDPFFSVNPGCPKEYETEEFFRSLDGVFITHAHFDHIGGLDDVKKANPEVPVVCQYDLGFILMQEGFGNITMLNYGGSWEFEDMTVSMVQACHTSAYKETVGTPMYGGAPAGYIFNMKEGPTLYHSGDTTMMMDMKLIQDFYQPDIAILSCSGHFVMGPKEAAYAVKNLLDVKYVIPSHQFPNENTTRRPDVLEWMMENNPVIGTMMDKDDQFAQLLEDYEKTEVVALGYGEEREFSHADQVKQ